VDEFIGNTDINEKWSKLPPEEVAQITALYDGCVRMFDDSCGPRDGGTGESRA
jgi:hypothetical protein